MTADDRVYIATMFEEMLDRFQVISEMFESMQKKMDTFVTKDEFHARWDEINAIKMVVKETNKDVAGHEKRIVKLEQTR